MHFTEAKLKAFTAPAGKADHYEWDDDMPGFGIRVQFGGSKSYILKYRIGGKQRKLRIGGVGKITLTDAKTAANRMFAQVSGATGEGVIDPAHEMNKSKVQAGITFNPAYDGYLEKLKLERAESYYVAAKMYLETHFKSLHGRALATIDKETVGNALDEISKKRGRIAANRARATGSAFYNWAIRKFNGLDKNPFEWTNKNLEEPRNRDFRARELKAIWHGVPDNQFGDIVRLMMLTMQRRNEIGGLPTKEFNRKERQIEIDASRTKNGNESIIPLSDAAFSILDKYYDPKRKFIFGRRDTGFSGWSKAKAELDEALKAINKHWTFHDFRRAGKTVMEQELDVPDNVSEAILNHSKKGLSKVYNGASYIRQKRDALNKYADYLMTIVT